MTTVVLDLDGVLRLWPSDGDVEAIEARHGLAVGAFNEMALAPYHLGRVTTGRLRKQEWRDLVASGLGAAAADEWFARATTVNQDVATAVTGLRDRGFRVVLFSNGTDELERELATLGVLDLFDHVYNSWFLGHCKPDAAAFGAVRALEGCAPGDLWLVDDVEANVTAARQAGWNAHLYRLGESIWLPFVKRGS